MKNSDTLVGEHTFVFNKGSNGGEALSLHTKFYDNGDHAVGLPRGIYWNQELVLSSYCNEAALKLFGASITPESLRQLANELETAYNKAVCDYDMRLGSTLKGV